MSANSDQSIERPENTMPRGPKWFRSQQRAAAAMSLGEFVKVKLMRAGRWSRDSKGAGEKMSAGAAILLSCHGF